MSAAGAEDEPADPSDRFAARGISFGCLATAALVLPGALGLDLMPVGTPAGPLDGGVAVLLVLGVLCFGWPPPGRRRAAGALLDLAAGAACVHLFLVLALCAGAQVPGAPSEVAGGTHGWGSSIRIASAWAHAGVAGWIAGGCAAALVFLGRLGGAAGAGAVVALPVALAAGLQGASDAGTPGVEVELVPVQLELRGPLAPTVLRVGDAPPLEVSADLGPGATRWVRAWIPARVDRVPGPLELSLIHISEPTRPY